MPAGDRVIDLAEGPARLKAKRAQLVIEREGHADITVPLEEIAAVVAGPQVVTTVAAAARLMEEGGVFIACDAHHQPAGWMLPVANHYTQTERMARQAAAAAPTRKRLWQQIVCRKIALQGALLASLDKADPAFAEMAKRVRSGDPENVEAQAARRYWTRLFGPDFRRDRDAPDANALLNYGYIVLRAAVARAVCAAGLHPSLGLHHTNRYDPFALAADLMEPFRPAIDRAVVRIVADRGPDAPLDKEAKAVLIGAVQARYRVKDEWRTLFDLARRAASSLAQVFMGERKTLVLPDGYTECV